MGIIFSTNPDFDIEGAGVEKMKTLSTQDQQLFLHLERKKGGRIVTLVKGFEGNKSDLIQLGKKIKKYCGTGGSVKEGNILVQGNVRDKIQIFLSSLGYQVKKSGS